MVQQTTEKGISFTEKEFDYACSKDLPVLAFLHQNPDEIPAGKTEIDSKARERLQEFRVKAQTGRVSKYWTSPEDLGGKVSRSLIKAMKSHPAEGWVRGRHAATTELLADVNELRAENSKLKANLMALGASSPGDTDQFAGGTDKVRITGTKEVGDDKTHEDWEIEITWDEIFAWLGPILYEECAEDRMRSHLSTYFRTRDAEEGAKVHSFNINNEPFQTIKIQFLALGLIMISERVLTTLGGVASWVLTPYGESYLLKLRAIRKRDFKNEIENMKDSAIKKE